MTLTVDLIGHGDSDCKYSGFIDTPTDLTLGLSTAIQYLREQPGVNSSHIGLVGHSLGAGAVRATAASSKTIMATVFIAGGLSNESAKSAYGVLNATFPKNLLVVVGEYDVLFDIPRTLEELRPLFGHFSEIVPGTTYGWFSDGTARRVILPKTTHLFEPVDPVVISEVVQWMKRSLTVEFDGKTPPLTFQYRDLAILVGGLVFTGLVFPVSTIIVDYWIPRNGKRENPKGLLRDRHVLLLWGALGLLLFLPMFIVGSGIPFPPSVFGNAFAWWLLSVGLGGLFIARFLLPRFTDGQLDLAPTPPSSSTRTHLLTGISMVALLYGMVHISEIVFLTDLRISVVPLFSAVPHAKRGLVFLMFIPFYWVYFWGENLYLLRLRQRSSRVVSPRFDMFTTVAIRVVPYVALLATHYLPMILLNVRVFPAFLGFIMEFMLGMIPFFVLSTAYSWWFEHKTFNITLGVTVNAMLLAWVSAVVFPITI
jgi:hypothetical protein